MTKSIPSLLAILIFSLTAIIHETPNAEPVHSSLEGHGSHWLTGSIRNQNELFKKNVGK